MDTNLINMWGITWFFFIVFWSSGYGVAWQEQDWAQKELRPKIKRFLFPITKVHRFTLHNSIYMVIIDFLMVLTQISFIISFLTKHYYIFAYAAFYYLPINIGVWVINALFLLYYDICEWRKKKKKIHYRKK